MCTVTFVPVKSGVLITSSRDEKQVRKAALPPQGYIHGGNILTYPKDAEAGGTWVAVKDNGDAAVLLNGGYVKHTPSPPYHKSRGLVMLDIFSDEEPFAVFKDAMLSNIEPFTLVLYIAGELTECRWDGRKKYSTALQHNIPHIWSSVTLYDESVRQRRERWFAEWLHINPAPAMKDIINFHQYGGDGDVTNDVCMSRDGIYQTVSITVLQLVKDDTVMQYVDLANNTKTTRRPGITSPLAV
jgi:hypothetical protein